MGFLLNPVHVLYGSVDSNVAPTYVDGVMQLHDFLKRLYDMPFRPFRVHISDGSVVEVAQPGMVIPSDTTVILPTMFGTDEEGHRYAKRWRTIALDHITQFSGVETSDNGKRRKRG